MVAQSMSGWLVKLTNFVADLPAFLQQSVPVNQLIKGADPSGCSIGRCRVFGYPGIHVAGCAARFLSVRGLLSPVVKHGVHAVAVDERRADFTPTLWEPDGRIMQTLFPGCHSDVGGGFIGPESRGVFPIARCNG
jgi:T6SS, Phospholipase effector Tle1-like, catalytic domain